MKQVLRCTLLFIFVLYFILTTLVIAKANNEFPVEQFPYTELSIQVMPEFTTPEGWPKNQPAILIGYHGRIINKTGNSYFGAIKIPIPTNENNFTLGYLAQYSIQGEELIELEAEINKEKGIISWKPSKPIENEQTYEFVIEYYYIPNEDTDLTYFSYSYTPKTIIENANILIYQPVGANEFKISPITDYRTKNDYGIPIYIYQYKNLAQGQKKVFDISYIKKGGETTLDYIHELQLGVNPYTDSQNQEVIKSEKPLMSNSSVYAISIAIVISSFLFFLESKKGMSERNNEKIKMGKDGKSELNYQLNNEEEIKQLRKLYAEGIINHQTYIEKLSQLNNS